MNLDTFLAVLRGDSAAVRGVGTGKVLASGPRDEVFLYFVDHGGLGLASFPSSYLDAPTLARTLQDMHRHSRYSKLLLYMDTCQVLFLNIFCLFLANIFQSGSMFEDSLPPDIDVLAVTAADATEPSFACFYDAELGTFLADVFSISWMEDSESGGRGEEWEESLLEQIRRVRSRTAEWSHTSVYGDTDMETLSLATFQGDGGGEAGSSAGVTIRDAVPATTADLVRLQINGKDNEEAMSRLLRNQQTVDRTYDNILARYLENNNTGDSDGVLDRDCYFSVVKHVHDFCFNLGENSEALQKIQRLRGLCFKEDKKPALNSFQTLIKEVCYNL